MPEIDIGGVPFQEAIDHFRGKLNIPTSRWDEMLGEVHAKAFTVAGAMKADLLRDLRLAVDQAIAEGVSIGDFRKRFDQAVTEHGWSYKGSRGWRTRVIYDNNLRTARMAGKWQQFQRTKKTRPYLTYQTAGDSRVRPQHRAWNGLVLPVDDTWWDTHYPPNDYGCRCTARSLSARDLERDGLAVSEPPPTETSERINTRTGEVYGEVPNGIGVGWDHNVGKAWLGPDIAFGEKLMAMPSGLRDRALQNAGELAPHLERAFAPWVTHLATRKQPIGEVRTVGYLSPRVINELVRRGQTPATAVITATDRDVMHMLRDAKDGKHLPADLVRALPSEMTRPRAILWDKRDPALLYVFDVPGDATGKLVVKINYQTKVRAGDDQRYKLRTNAVRTGSLVPVISLDQKDSYEVIEGKL